MSAIAETIGLSTELLWSSPQTKGMINPPRSDTPDAIAARAIEGSEQDIALGIDNYVYVFAQLPSDRREEIAKAIFQRSVLVKGISEVWAHASSYEELRIELQTRPDPRIKKWITVDKTYAFIVQSFGRHISLQEQVSRMNKLSFLFTGKEKARLQNPDITLGIFEKWSRPTQSATPLLEQIAHRRIDVTPWWRKYNLPERIVLGPTTMENKLAFIMANQARIKSGTFVLDPFCGTGGLLISATHFGGICFGSDIDSRVLRGWGVSQINNNHHGMYVLNLFNRADPEGITGNTDIFRNFREYNMNLPEILRVDSDGWTSMSTKDVAGICRPWVDAIITDPPYGIRATVREASSKQTCGEDIDPCTTELENKQKQMHNLVSFAQTTVTTVEAVISALLILAANLLVDNGRLVFFLPIEITRVTESIKKMSQQHAGEVVLFSDSTVLTDLHLKAASLQELSAGVGRVLITMQRVPRASTRS